MSTNDPGAPNEDVLGLNEQDLEGEDVFRDTASSHAELKEAAKKLEE